MENNQSLGRFCIWGLGSATQDFDDLFSKNNHYAAGTGFRYLMARRYGLHLGLDFAVSEDDNALYIKLGTGF
ncbi:hypothetical protein L0B53_00660 [Vibrio sp. SS-MA-C1-2]|uniref:hypothetical protein n=1 Tax=Vibrio sp. SS-MA-C1-2 TaxID=2908646 RepID=UPI001F3D047B|nr:hypothetical protein [Vibrio sp. SS-MA-C1-2]UJF17322.1 hypothetical protein L0B53_00660 [Vibrio sp. SS-MA-C1-2]